MSALRERVQLGTGWNEALGAEFQQPYMEALSEFVRQERRGDLPIYPPAPLVFNAFQQTPFEQVKVVIVGQDPYHGPGQAHGLCFSVQEGIPFPPSLRNIFKELVADLQIPLPTSGSLLPWAKQGVLLLNATLTVRQGEPKSHHGKGWEQFTDAAIRALLGQKVVFLLWGASAREKVRNVMQQSGGDQPKVLTCPHPSPLSAYHGFFGSGHFSKANAYLAELGVDPVDWRLP